MKKHGFVAILILVVCLPLGVLLAGCSVGTVRYASYLPTVYEAELTRVDDQDNTYRYSVIKRYETIGDQDCYVFYGKFKYQAANTDDVTTEEWLSVWDETNAAWDSYLWSSADQQWEKTALGTTFDAVTDVATYLSNGDGVELKKTDLVNETDEYLEYNLGGTYADRLKISNNVYHICLYHGYNHDGEFTSYDKFKKFTFDESTTPIPHINKFAFQA